MSVVWKRALLKLLDRLLAEMKDIASPRQRSEGQARVYNPP